jgi:hypothetical protein
MTTGRLNYAHAAARRLPFAFISYILGGAPLMRAGGE